jgi:hypothetical protein
VWAAAGVSSTSIGANAWSAGNDWKAVTSIRPTCPCHVSGKAANPSRVAQHTFALSSWKTAKINPKKFESKS